MSDTPTLFSTQRLGALTLPNRIVMAPLTRCRAGEGNVPTPLAALYYAQRASAGLIVSEATQIVPEGQGYPSTPGIHSDAQVAGWRRVTDAVHAAGGRMFLQLWHVGRISHQTFQPGEALPVAPSAIAAAGQAMTRLGMQDHPVPRALELAELPGVVESYAMATRRALAAGFDGVEIHAANGYLLDQFLRDKSNQRSDAYGGSIANRIRLLDEVVSAVTAVAGEGRVGVRLSPENTFNDIDDSDPQALFHAVATMLRGRVEYLHVVEGEDRKTTGEPRVDYGSLRTAFGGTYMACCNYTPERAAAALEAGHADLVAFGRLYLGNPDLVTRIRLGLPLTRSDAKTWYGGAAKGYTDYPVASTLEG
ncbi:MAG: alkene reductase [Rhodocyclaceae bacterium]|nr:alkene reductase [Rhodocyclaceae bacterium]